MPLPRWLAKTNKAGLNRVAKHIAPWAPMLTLAVHTRRKSGRRNETPVMVLPAEDGFIVALTYGGDSAERVKNVVAAGDASCAPVAAP